MTIARDIAEFARATAAARHLATINAETPQWTDTTDDEIARLWDAVRAAERALATIHVRPECVSPMHDHTTYEDGNGGTLADPIMMFCQHCGAPSHYDSFIEGYQHDDEYTPDCFLITAHVKATDCDIEEPAA